MSKSVNFAWPVTAVSKYVYSCFDLAIKRYMDKMTHRRLLIFGAGIRGTLFSMMLEKNGIYEFDIIDNNKKKWGGNINGHLIISIDEAVQNYENPLIFVTIENGEYIEPQLSSYNLIKNIDYEILDPKLYDYFLKEFQRRSEMKLMIMGDCGMTHISVIDEEHSNAAEMIKKRVGENNVKILAMHGMGMRGFYNILCAQIDQVKKPKSLLLNINLETFTDKHHMLPRTQHHPLMRQIQKVSNYYSTEMTEYVQLTKNRFDVLDLEFAQNARMNYRSNNALFMKMNYMYSIRDSNEGVMYYKKIIDKLKEQDINAYFYIPPVNHEQGFEYFGQAFYKAYERNCDFLKKIAIENNVRVLDLSYLLAKDEFADYNTIDESANSYGREKLVSHLINFVSKELV